MKTKLCLLSCLLLLKIVAIAQIAGSVVDFTKISSTTGGFTGQVQNSSYFGWAIECIGDIDNDGVMDLAVSAPYKNVQGNQGSGAIFILRMNANGTVKATQEISRQHGNLNENLSSGAYFGIAIANLGDVNGDGINDIAVSSNQRRIYILCLDTNGTVKSKTIIGHNIGGLGSVGAGFGTDIACIGDFDNDGYPEIVTSDYYSNTLYFIRLDSNLLAKSMTSYSSNIYRFGTSIASLGDIDNDGITDIAVGAMYDNSVSILRLNANLTVKASTKITNNMSGLPNVLNTNDWFGIEVENAGDLDGDGINDLMVGAAQDDNGGSSWMDYGAVYVLFLNSNGSIKGHYKISRSEPNFNNVLSSTDKFGASIAMMNDNNNGTVKYAISGHFDDDGGFDKGAFYVMNINKAFSISTTSTDINCHGLCTGNATAVTTGGVPPFTYLWSNNDTSSSISNLCAGTYTVTVTGANSASLVQGVVVSQPPPLGLQTSGDVIICQGQSTVLSASGSGGTPPIFYYWSHALGMGQSKTVSPSSTISYIVHALDINGCTSLTDTITVTVQPYQQANIFGLSGSYCANDSMVTISATPAGGSFSGAGVSGNTFSPALAGAGVHNITYSVPGGCISPAQFQLMVYAVPQASVSGLDTGYCSNSPTVNITGIPAGGSFSGNGVSYSTFSPALAGQGNHVIIYSYTDTNGCAVVATFTTNVKISPTAYAGSNISIQPGTSATLMGTASGGSGMYSYIWAPPDSFFFPNVQAPTTIPLYTTNSFTLTVGDLLTQCQATSGIIVTVQSASLTATATTTPSTACYAAPVQLYIAPSGGYGNYTYSWSSNPPGFTSTSQNPTVYPLVNTTYTVTVSSASLSTTAMTLVNVHPLSSASISALPSEVCENDAAISLSAIPSGGSFTGVGVASASFSPGMAGNGIQTIIYSLTDTNNCYAGDTAIIHVIPAPVVSFIGLPLSVCSSDLPYVLTANPTGGSFVGNGISGNTFSPSSVNTGTHLISYSYTAPNGCTSVAYQAVIVKHSPVANAGSDQVIPCGGSGIQIGGPAQAGLSYSWAPGTGLSAPATSNPVANPPHSIQYVLFVTDANSLCTSTDTINIDVSGTPAISISNDTAACPGSMLSLFVSGANQYLWSTGDTTNVITIQPEQSGWYSVQASNNPQCYTLGMIYVEVLTPGVVFIGNDTMITEHQSISFDAGNGFINYLWSNNDISQTTTYHGYNLGTGNHEVWVIVSDSNGCINSDTLQLMVSVGIENTVKSDQIRVFPNPFNDEITIKADLNENDEIISIEMYCIAGKLLLEEKVSINTGLHLLYVSGLTPGVYFIKVNTFKQQYYFKVIK